MILVLCGFGFVFVGLVAPVGFVSFEFCYLRFVVPGAVVWFEVWFCDLCLDAGWCGFSVL